MCGLSSLRSGLPDRFHTLIGKKDLPQQQLADWCHKNREISFMYLKKLMKNAALLLCSIAMISAGGEVHGMEIQAKNWH